MTTHDPIIERYLSKFRSGLKGVEPGERADLVLEIESHIAEATGRGEPVADVLDRLGAAEKLARAYSVEALFSGSSRSNMVGRLLAIGGLLLTASIPSMVIIPVLGGIGLGFSLGGLALIGISIFPFYYSPIFDPAPETLDRLLAGITGLGLVAGGLLCLLLLYWYMRLLIAAFRKVARL